MQQPLGSEEIIEENANDTALYDRYGHTLFAYVRLQVSSREEAEDLTLEVFLTALEHDNLSALPVSERLAWLRRVAYNRLVDRYRRAARHPVVVLDHVLETLLEDDLADPEQIVLRREMYQQLHQMVQKLPLLQQQLLRLRYGDGLRFAEIAVLLNKREAALRQLLSRTLATLRTRYNQLAQEGGYPC